MPEKPPPEYAMPYVGQAGSRPGGAAGDPEALPRQFDGLCLHLAHWGRRLPHYLPANVPSALAIALYVHELGHCNGWRHEHEPSVRVSR